MDGSSLLVPKGESALVLPAVVAAAGKKAQQRFLEFFLVNIRNRNTRQAYGLAVSAFLSWCNEQGLSLEGVSPMAVSAYIEQHPGSAPTIKQHLAAIRRLFDYLVTGQIVPFNPASPVRGPRYRISKGKTPVLTAEETKALLATCDRTTIVGLRDLALFSVMVYSFARVSAVLGTKVEDYYRRQNRGWLRLHEKGGRFHEVPLHHLADEALKAYLIAARISERKAPLFQSTEQHSGNVTGRGMTRFSALERVKKAASYAGLHDKISNHSFRATGITLFRKAGGTLDKAQQIAGHASAETTRLYDRSGDEISAGEVERIII